MADFFAHPSSIIDSAQIGEGTRIWAFVHILPEATIGADCNICDHCFIEKGVAIGNNVTIKSGIYIWEGVTIEDDVFLGPNVVFTNDLRPRSRQRKPAEKTLIKKGASIGANSTVLAGVTVGSYAMAGIGSVITRDVPDHALVYGNPARHMGWVDEYGQKLKQGHDGEWIAEDGIIFIESKGGLSRKKV